MISFSSNSFSGEKMKKQLPKRRSRIPAAATPPITALLSDINNPDSLGKVIEWAYPQLHDIAVHHLRGEPRGGTLQPTALVNEVCIRFLEGSENFKNRRYFFTAASDSMRRVLVDRARMRHSKRRGGHLQRVDFSYAEQIGFENPAEILHLDAALKRLESAQPLWSKLVELRIFCGLSTVDAAYVLGIGDSTARRHWAGAMQWLRRALQDAGEGA
jgi:RNA polymerase sigma factor (TIGR02999 family)